MTSVYAAPRSFQTTLFENIHASADANRDGKLSKTEFDAYKTSQEQIRHLVANPDHNERLDALKVIGNNFNQIAYRALKQDEVTTMDWRDTDSTIEIADLRKLAGFDGGATDVTLRDVAALSRGNTNDWPTMPHTGPYPLPGPNPWPNPVPPAPPAPPSFPPQFQQLLQLLLMLLFSGMFRR